MKKIKFFILGLFSLFFFGYSFSEILYLPGKSVNNVITFEQPGTNNNITYLTTSFSGYQYSRLSYIGSLGTKSFPEYYYVSDYENGGSTLNLDYSQDIFYNHQLQGIGLSTKSQREGYGLLTLSWNSSLNTFYPDFVKFYHQVADSSTYNNNYIVSFDENLALPDTFRYLSNTYARFFYSPNANSNNLFWKHGMYAPAYADHNGINPIDYQLFAGTGFYSRLGFYKFPFSNWAYSYSPGLGYGFSFYYDKDWSYSFGTVFPFYDHGLESSDFVNGVYTLPSWAYTTGFYMFRLDGSNLNSDNSRIGVLSPCNDSACNSLSAPSWSAAKYYYSEYSCLTPGNGLSINPNTHYINIKESCTFITGGVVFAVGDNRYSSTDETSNVLCEYRDPAFNYFTFNYWGSYNGSTQCDGVVCMICDGNGNIWGPKEYYQPNDPLIENAVPFVSFSKTSSSLYLKTTTQKLYKSGLWYHNSHYDYSTDGISSVDFYSFKFGDIDYSVHKDILSTFNNTDPNPGLTYGTITTGDSILQQLCSQSMYKNALFCKGYNGTVVYLSGSNQPYQISTTTSGGRIFTTITDYSETIEYYYYTGEDGSLNIECIGDWCPIIENNGSTQGLTSNGFMLGTGYFFEFFNKTGYWGKCPYPYTNINFGYQQGVLAKLNNLVGDFDIFLPVNCFIAAFTAGKDYNYFSSFLSDISSPLITKSDSFKGLLAFFDMLLAIGIFFFLFKFYHLIKK